MSNRPALLCSLALLALAFPDAASAQRITAPIPDTTPLGSGPFPVAPVMDKTLPHDTIYAAKAKNTGRMPVVVWANGGCFANGTQYRWFLSEIASHGFFVISMGAMGPNEREVFPEEKPLPPNQKPPMPPLNSIPPPTTSPQQMIAAIDWAAAANARPDSPYHGRIDTSKVAMMGQSCGGVHAIVASKDPRVTTTVVMDSGLFPDGSPSVPLFGVPGLSKKALNHLRGPVAYISGDQADIAYPNARDDVQRLRVGVFHGARIGTPHAGTFGETNGGDFGRVTVAWLSWALKGDARAKQMFVGKDCGLCRDKHWLVEQKNLK